jgi:1,4-alpha-glucan branching enzyme
MPGVSRDPARGALALVLHTHMPYVEGFGTWPFGEEWLWEAIACCYLPLLDLLDDGAPLTLSLTPVLCDQLEVTGLASRFASFVAEVRSVTHAEDAAGLRAAGEDELALELERSWEDYRTAVEALERRGGDLLAALTPHAHWTSSATHAVLPLLATDAALRLQLRTGVVSHERRFGGWRGGLWLPECAYAPWLLRALEDVGARATCVELTARQGLGSVEHLRPRLTESGVVLVPIDRETISLVWSDAGYPAAGAYRDYHHHTVHHHNPWNNAGRPYDRERARGLAREHAADFVARVLARLRAAQVADAGLPAGGLVVCALDTELLGHWWFEGVWWLQAVVEECARQGLELLRLDDAVERVRGELAVEDPPAAGAGRWPAGSWGSDYDLSTWSGPAVAEMAFALREAELSTVAAGPHAGDRAVRELLALQASDWPFMVSRQIAAPYARERFAGHERALAAALAGAPGPQEPGIRNLAVDADAAALLAPL